MAESKTSKILKLAGQIDGWVAGTGATLALASDPKIAHYAMIAVMVAGFSGALLSAIARALGEPNPVPALPAAPVSVQVYPVPSTPVPVPPAPSLAPVTTTKEE